MNKKIADKTKKMENIQKKEKAGKENRLKRQAGTLAGRILPAAALFCCLIIAVGLVWINREDKSVGANTSGLINESVTGQTGYGFKKDSTNNGESYILLRSTGASDEVLMQISPADTSNKFISYASVNVTGSPIASVSLKSSALPESAELKALKAGKTQLKVKVSEKSSPTGSALENVYNVYVKPEATDGITKHTYDATSSGKALEITTNVTADSGVYFALSQEDKMENALKNGATKEISNQSVVVSLGGIEVTIEDYKLIVKSNQTAGNFYLYFYIKDDAGQVVTYTRIDITYTNQLSDIEINLDQNNKSVDLKDVYNLAMFTHYFKSDSSFVGFDYDNTTGIIKSKQKTVGKPNPLVLVCQEDTDFLINSDGMPFKKGETLKVTVYVVDKAAFIENGEVSEEISKKVAKNGNAVLSYIYTTPTVPIWKSSDKSVATVDNGVIKGLSAGKAEITGTVVDDGVSKVITCHVEVVDTKDVLSISDTSYTATVGRVFYLSASGSALSRSKWTVSDETVVKIDEGGKNTDGYETVKFMPLKAGTAVINLYNAEDAIMASCSVSVEIAPTNIEFSNGVKKVDLNMSIGSYQLSVNMTPPDPYASLVWESTDTKVAEVSENGLCTLKGTGTTLITVFPKHNPNNIHATMTINVTQPTTGINLDIVSATLSVGEKLKLSYTMLPSTASDKNVRWSTMDKAIATVDNSGLVTAKTIGQTYIVVVSENGSYMATCSITVIQAATGVKLDASNLSLKVGDVYYVQTTFTPANATDKKLTWTAQDPKICTVTNTGKVTAVSPGTTCIFVKTTAGDVTYLYVTVQSGVLGLALDKTEKSIIAGKKFRLNPIFTPEEPTNTKVTWKSSNTGIATVDKDGKVITKKTGMAIIMCTSADGGYMASCAVTVKPGVSALSLDETEIKILTGKTRKLTVTFSPEHPSSKKVTWTSSNPSVVSVNDKGKIKGLKGGSAIITCTSDVGGVSASCVVSVEQLVSYITLNKRNINVGLGRTYQLKGTVDSNDVTNKVLKWVSSNKKVATIDKNGNVTGKRLGNCTIICKATDGSKAKAKCKVRVIRQMSSLSLDKSTIRLLEGKSTKIRAIVKPASSSIKKVNWSSTDENVATVDVNGNIYAVAEGVCKIKAKATDGSGKKAECWLYVMPKVEASSVVISQKDLYLPVGITENLQVSVLPSNNTDSISFTSDNKLIATVSQSGRVTAIRPGQATITCTTSSGKSASSTVTVLGLNWTSLNMNLYETQTLRVEGLTTGVVWESEDPTVATVSNGTVTSRKAGTTRIIASVKGIKLYCTVTVSGNL